MSQACSSFCSSARDVGLIAERYAVPYIRRMAQVKLGDRVVADPEGGPSIGTSARPAAVATATHVARHDGAAGRACSWLCPAILEDATRRQTR